MYKYKKTIKKIAYKGTILHTKLRIQHPCHFPISYLFQLANKGLNKSKKCF